MNYNICRKITFPKAKLKRINDIDFLLKKIQVSGFLNQLSLKSN